MLKKKHNGHFLVLYVVVKCSSDSSSGVVSAYFAFCRKERCTTDTEDAPYMKGVESGTLVLEDGIVGNASCITISSAGLNLVVLAAQAREWKKETSLVHSYINNAFRPETSPNRMMAVLIGTFRKIVEHKDLDSKLKDYCAALIQQFKSEESKERFRKEYRKLYNEHQISELEEEADSEARITSRIITTVESRAHRENMQKRLDQWFNEDERNTDDESDTEEGLQETEEDIQLFTYMDDPFREEEEQILQVPGAQVLEIGFFRSSKIEN
ncbi:hypothetical protein MBANPS3_009487 [Mucor bainieri]